MMAINKFKGLIYRSRTATPDLKSPRTPKTLQIPDGVPEAPQDSTPTAKELRADSHPESRPRQKSIAEEAAELVEAKKAYLASPNHPSKYVIPGEKGHAQNLAETPPAFLGIGIGGRDEFTISGTPADIVSDSPTGIDFDVYDRAFEAEVERIRSEKRGHRRTTYLTKLVNEKEKYFGDDCMIMEAGRSIPTIASSGVHKANSAAVKTLEHIGLAHRQGAVVHEGKEKESPKGDLSTETRDEKRTESHDSVQAIKDRGHRFAEVVMGTMAGVKPKVTGELRESKSKD
jgi:calcium/calmodulin-dependent protein kinase kinase 2